MDTSIRSRWTQRDALHGIYLLTSLVAFVLVQIEVPDPYLDEIFHIPQTQKYCAGDYKTWDPAITTPPGLYLLSAIPLSLLHIPCNPPLLRLTNFLLTTLLIPHLITIILINPYPNLNKPTKTIHFLQPSLEALIISSFPLVFFFGNLYYTDIASLAGVLGCMALTGKKRYWSASIVGAWSVGVRQTNIVWVGFVLGVEVLRVISVGRERRSKDGQEVEKGDFMIGEYEGIGQIVTSGLGIMKIIFDIPGKVARVIIPFLPTFAGFIVFLKWNGGIVLGHKENHQPVLHIPQVLYFIAFATIMLFPALLQGSVSQSIAGTFNLAFGTPRRLLISGILAGVILISIHRYTFFHPFLLADNRHYVFYLLRWVLLPYPAVKYALTPVYLGCIFLWTWRLRHSATIFWLLAFLACTSITLIPTPLIEPRYFLVPTILLRLQLSHLSSRSGRVDRASWDLWTEYGWYTVINILTVGLFLGRKFRWEGWEGWMRFMW